MRPGQCFFTNKKQILETVREYLLYSCNACTALGKKPTNPNKKGVRQENTISPKPFKLSMMYSGILTGQ